jgi:hypothetical protein
MRAGEAWEAVIHSRRREAGQHGRTGHLRIPREASLHGISKQHWGVLQKPSLGKLSNLPKAAQLNWDSWDPVNQRSQTL